MPSVATLLAEEEFAATILRCFEAYKLGGIFAFNMELVT